MKRKKKFYNTEKVMELWLDAPDGTEEERDWEYELVRKLCSKFQRRYSSEINGKQLNLRAMWDAENGRWYVEVKGPNR